MFTSLFQLLLLWIIMTACFPKQGDCVKGLFTSIILWRSSHYQGDKQQSVTDLCSSLNAPLLWCHCLVTTFHLEWLSISIIQQRLPCVYMYLVPYQTPQIMYVYTCWEHTACMWYWTLLQAGGFTSVSKSHNTTLPLKVFHCSILRHFTSHLAIYGTWVPMVISIHVFYNGKYITCLESFSLSYICHVLLVTLPARLMWNLSHGRYFFLCSAQCSE